MSILNNWLKDFFRKKKEGNVHSPDFKDKIEEAFSSRGIQYYRFKKDSSMPYGRYMFIQTFSKEMDLRMKKKDLEAYLDKIERNVNGETGTINLTKVLEVVLNIRSRLALSFEMETIYDYASVIYFDQNENLYEYDGDYNRIKKQRWREDSVVDFFYTRPMSELFGLTSSSKTDLETYIKMQADLIKSPILDMQ